MFRTVPIRNIIRGSRGVPNREEGITAEREPTLEQLSGSPSATDVGAAPPAFSSRVKISPKLAWEYDYIDNQRQQLMNQIYHQRPEDEYIGSDAYFDAIREEAEAAGVDPLVKAKIEYADKNPHLSAAYTHNLVASWGFQEGSKGIPVIQRGISAAKRELRLLQYQLYSGADQQAFLNSEASRLVNRSQNELNPSSWQYRLILDLLTTDDDTKIKDELTISQVTQAWEIMDDTVIHRAETYAKLGRQFRVFLGGSIFSILALFVFYLTLPALAPLSEWMQSIFSTRFGIAPDFSAWGALGPLSASYGPGIYIAVILLALLGASISGLFSLRGLSPEATFPSETLALETLAYARMVLGVAAGLIVFIFLDSGVLTLSADVGTAGAVLLLAFLAGFSERLLSKAINSSLGDAESNIPEDPYLKQAGGR